MKTKHLIILFMALCLPLISVAQTKTDEIFDKFANKKGFTSVVVSGELLKMFVDNDADEDSYVVKMGDVGLKAKDFNLSDIRSIKVLNFEPENGAKDDFKSFIKDVESLLIKDKYINLVQVNSNGEKINVLALKEKTVVKEIIVYRVNVNEAESTFIYIEGPFREETINNLLKMAK